MTTDNKVALITGANKGIGLETARQLGKTGVTVLIGARDASRGEAAAQTLRGEGVDARFVPLDVTNAASLTDAAQTIAQDFGRLDILVNNAGIGTWGAASEETDDEWRATFETNVFGLVNATRTFLPLLRRSDAGRIVNLTSILGSLTLASDPHSPIGGNTGHGAAYAASKSAVNMYTVHLATELKDTPIKVNAAHPGWVKTELGGAGAQMEIVDGAKTSVELATVPSDGPTGGFFHLGKSLPW
jgi:NAD(P)-dependent dehydrogenase (short-subunit alcohol dehydrogenase family)